MSTIDQLKWATLTAAINEMKSPNQFLKKLLYSNHEPKSTEDIELSLLTKARQIAPFVRKNGEGIMVQGHGETFQTVSAPNIRIKRPFTPSELLFNRRPGTVIFSPGGDMQMEALNQHIARDVKVMADMITNAEEWLCAMSVQGTITYSAADNEVFRITFPKPAGHNITLATFWNDADSTLPNPEADIMSVKRLINDEVGLSVTDCILGVEASDAFQRLMKKQNLLATGSQVKMGVVTFTEQFNEDGVIFLGEWSGVRFWEYGRTATLDGSATSMIRTKYAEFLAVSPNADRVLYYGAIPDMDALEGRLFQGERFSKSWKVQDPSSLMHLAHSRPLPCPRRPGAGVSMKVVSG